VISNVNGLHLWHYPGTSVEISHRFQYLSTTYPKVGEKLKFPAILNFQSVVCEHASGFTTMRFNLAIVTLVKSEWTTQQREKWAYKLVLKPIEDEFIRQITQFRYFQNPMGRYPYTSVYVPTTGRALNSVMKTQYGDFLDAIELPNLTIKVLESCNTKSNEIIEESKKVTGEIKNIK
jgi:hypothetical protein